MIRLRIIFPNCFSILLSFEQPSRLLNPRTFSTRKVVETNAGVVLLIVGCGDRRQSQSCSSCELKATKVEGKSIPIKLQLTYHFITRESAGRKSVGHIKVLSERRSVNKG
ncbi:hypothetical protein MKW98_021009 [Papaver atlanticum]|uniref:Uncharacterized protein n=1 Tax=Papaver atlanticum TaxID=357466 RepID=A0AAD4SMT2_9MAGN|nr:hypothetical protein MKW98_021009 [Papaver atlanticum]